MNRFLAIPFSISLSLFVGYLLVETNSRAETGMISTPVPSTHRVLPEQWLGIDDARIALLQDWQTPDSNRQLFSRSRPYPPVYAFATLDEPNAETGQPFFTGLLQVVHDQQQTGVPVVIDRISGNIFIFAGDKWHTHDHWLEHLAPKRSAT